jgi:RimJ/RimL family protein N-acetyltransferase
METLSAGALASERLILEPLSVNHAVPMVTVLADLKLYDFTGGEPPTFSDLTDRYTAQARGGPVDGSQVWLNWMVRRRDSGELVGFVQATLEQTRPEQTPPEQSGSTSGAAAVEATFAWVITPGHQRQGLASEATGAMINWLRLQGVRRFAAYIHPDHTASMGVARRLGLAPTDGVEDGEVRWESQL